nr:uncharacterized protein LOC113803107 [Penaeus vannamei]
MTVPEANRTPPEISSVCHEQLPGLQICHTRTKEILQNLNKKHQDQMTSAPTRPTGVQPRYPSRCHPSSSHASKKAAGPPSGRKQDKKLQDALDANQDTLVIALDIAGAFDRVWHRGLLDKLEAGGISSNLLRLFGDYLTGRAPQVVIGGQLSDKYSIKASVPQGSVLGPIL